jgi:hypothetical protein
MKKAIFIASYAFIASGLVLLNSCQDDPVTPNDPNGGGSVDTTWVDDSTNTGGGTDNPIDSSGWNNGGGGSIDSTGNEGGGNGTPSDSTWIDSLGG